GAWMLDRRIARTSRPDRYYAAFEFIIGIWSLVSIPAIILTNDIALRTIGIDPSPLRQWLVAFIGPFIALLPATFSMGATWPAIERFASPLVSARTIVAGLYAANTLGAVAGIIGSSFWLMPALGLS